MSNNIGFEVTVEFDCPDMIDEKTFREDFNSDPWLAYKFISDNFKDSPICFNEDEKITKIEILNK